MEFIIIDRKYKTRIYMHEDFEAQFVNSVATVSPEVAYHMSRTQKDNEFDIEDKILPFNSNSWKKEKRMVWGHNFAAANGFGMVAENTVKELLKIGVNVQTWGGKSGIAITGSKFVDPIVEKAIGKPIYPDCIEIQHCQPPSFRANVVQRSWIYSMFETTHTPKKWIAMLNAAERIIVPSQWLVDSWREQGVTRPIDVIGHGVDPKVYYYMERPIDREKFTFLHYCQLGFRKGTDLVARAFVEEFKNEKDVQLILKNIFPYFPVKYGLPKVKYISATYSKRRMKNLLFKADCMVFPTRGEGFGLPALEAMATGLPTIVTNWGGCKDFIDSKDTLPLDYEFSRATEFDAIYHDELEKGEDTGMWAEPSYEQLRKHMRWVYENRKKAKIMGKRAAKRIAKDWTWEKQIKKLYKLIDKNI